ncbi:hypothetical protein [Vibrio makurazakiensis]
MSDQYANEENLELLDAMEIGFNLAEYEFSTSADEEFLNAE